MYVYLRVGLPWSLKVWEISLTHESTWTEKGGGGEWGGSGGAESDAFCAVPAGPLLPGGCQDWAGAPASRPAGRYMTVNDPLHIGTQLHSNVRTTMNMRHRRIRPSDWRFYASLGNRGPEKALPQLAIESLQKTS